MKSERRRELQHNDLAEWFLTTYQTMLPYRNSIIFGTLLVIVLAVAWMIWRNHSQATAAEAWNAVEINPAIIQYPAAQMSPVYQFPAYAEVMDTASRNYSGTKAGEWARVLVADTCLCLGENEVMAQKDNALQHFNIAMDHYQKTLDEMSNPIARQRAMFGKCRLLESVGKLPEAAAAYQDLNKEYPKGIYAAVAEERLAQLGKPETIEFYKALAQYNPKSPKEKPAEKKNAGKAAAGPRGKLENMTLPENPEEPAPPKPPIKPGETSSGTAAGAATGAAKTSAASALPATSAARPPAAPKTTAAIPLATGAPAASSSGPAKK